MASDKDLAMLPKDVREALSYFADAETALEGEGHNGTMYTTIRDKLLRLARENAILEIKNRGTLANNLCPDHRDKQTGKPCLACTIETLTRQKERAEAELAALRKRVAEYHEKLGDALGRETRERLRAERSEAELATLRRRIAEATKAVVHDDANLGPSLVAYMEATDLSKTFALLPVGGE